MHTLSDAQRRVLTDLLTGILCRHLITGCYIHFQTPTGTHQQKKVLSTICRRLNNLGLIEPDQVSVVPGTDIYRLTEAGRATLAQED